MQRVCTSMLFILFFYSFTYFFYSHSPLVDMTFCITCIICIELYLFRCGVLEAIFFRVLVKLPLRMKQNIPKVRLCKRSVVRIRLKRKTSKCYKHDGLVSIVCTCYVMSHKLSHLILINPVHIKIGAALLPQARV